jgi:hypothetical protein
MSEIFNLSDIDSYTVIPQEVLDRYRENCKLDELTVGCLARQLNIFDRPNRFAIIINKKRVTDIDTVITVKDVVAVLPIIAGG